MPTPAVNQRMVVVVVVVVVVVSHIQRIGCQPPKNVKDSVNSRSCQLKIDFFIENE